MKRILTNKIIGHNEVDCFADLVAFMSGAEALYNKRPTTKETHLGLLKLFFDEKSKFIVIEEDHKILACATITTSPDYPTVCFIGNYHLPINHENREDIRKSLFQAVYLYCSSLQINNIIGPVNFNTWLSNRFSYPVPSNQHFWEPINPTEYPEDFMSENFEIDKKYFTYFLPTIDDMQVLKPASDLALSQGYRISPIDLADTEHQKLLYQLNCECFSENYFYTPISFDQYKNSLLASLKGMNLSYCCFIENDERKWGYVFSIPENNQIIIKTVLISPLSRSTGLGSALIFESLKRAKNNGFTEMVGALVREGNPSQYFFKRTSKPYQINEYLLFKKVI